MTRTTCGLQLLSGSAIRHLQGEFVSIVVADPGFPVGGGGVPSHWGVPTSDAGTFW